MLVKQKDIKQKRIDANQTLKNIEAFVDVHLGKISDTTRTRLIEHAENAFNICFECSKAQGLPISSITARRAAEHFIIGCVNKPWTH